LLAMTKPEEFQKVWQDIQQKFAGKVTVTSSRDNFLELMEPGVNKWNAVKAVAASYGIRPEEVMCIGDSNNDLSMIENAGIGVAVANAKPAVQAAAKLVTASNDEDGVAEAIETVLQP
ncbi:MAG: HAD hydrolase family protein, partial [Acidaminococcaceae bacterium]|nr:HAD hydrolase family protein [Acidaminococcaceae bacterium]